MAVNDSTDVTVVDLLIDQHMRIKSLFSQVLTATGDLKAGLFHDLVQLLAVHEGAEEQVVHPTVRRRIDGAEPIVRARLDEEESAKRALSELYDLGTDHPEFNPRLRALADDVVRHATAEENEEFPRLQAFLSRDELIRMAGTVRIAEAVVPARPHPTKPNESAADLADGPPLALFARVRDALRGS
jgi:hemerythrin superfamily protein